MIWLVENWFIFVGIVAVAAFVGYGVGCFMRLPRESQIKRIKEGLVYICLRAEKEWGSGTGAVKLQYVYDWFVQRFPAVAKVVSFDTFSIWVDVALKEMRELISENKAVREVVEGVAK